MPRQSFVGRPPCGNGPSHFLFKKYAMILKLSEPKMLILPPSPLATCMNGKPKHLCGGKGTRLEAGQLLELERAPEPPDLVGNTIIGTGHRQVVVPHRQKSRRKPQKQGPRARKRPWFQKFWICNAMLRGGTSGELCKDEVDQGNKSGTKTGS